MSFLKLAVVLVLLLLGALFVYQGLGFDFRILNFDSLDRFMLPIGGTAIVLAVVLARYWHTFA